MPLIFIFSMTAMGFSLGALISSLINSRNVTSFHFFCVTLFLFLLLLHFRSERNFFYFYVAALFIPIGFGTLNGLRNSKEQKFYFFDLLGGALGLCYGQFSPNSISIECSLALFMFVGSGFTLIDTLYLRRSRQYSLVIFLCCFCVFILQIFTDSFNLMTWTANISEPKVDVPHDIRNGFSVLKKQRGHLLYSKWSSLDRVDIIEIQNVGVVAYANNTAWTQVATLDSNDQFPFLKKNPRAPSVLSIGSGGGSDFITAKRLGADTIVGVEINRSLVELLKKELNFYSKELLNHVEFISQDARFFLMNDQRKFDLILNKYTDLRGRSYRYFAWYNLLRSTDTIKKMIETLTPTGLCVWTFHFSEPDLDLGALNIYAATQDFVKTNNGLLQDHLLIVEDKLSQAHENKTLHHVVFSRAPISPQLIANNFIFKQGFSLVDLQSIFNSKTLSTQEPLTDDLPIIEITRSSHFLLANIIFCVVLVFLALLPLFLKFGFFSERNLTTSQFEVRRRLALTGMITGFYFGLIQTALIQKAEYVIEAQSFLYALLLASVLLACGASSLVSASISLKRAMGFYGVAPLGGLAWIFLDPDSSYISQEFIFIVFIFFYFICISLLFPKVLSEFKKMDALGLPLLFCTNLISSTIGSLTFCLYFIYFGRPLMGHFVFVMAVICTLLVVLFCKSTIQNFRSSQNSLSL